MGPQGRWRGLRMVLFEMGEGEIKEDINCRETG
jgi:hypothetical protein